MAQRKRKTHTKSRRGCGNCKIRRVKCDEGKPGCSKCASYGITCSYGDPEVQSLFGGGGPLTCSNNEMLMTMINVNLSGKRPVRYQLRERDIELLHLFQNHTVYTMGTRDTVHIYRNEMVREAATHPWLMHCMLAFASMHRRDFSGLAATAEEEYHWYQGAALFRDLLSRPVQNEDKDAIWATAAILGASGFYKIHASSPEEAWPLNPEEDLGWLALSDGKKAIWKIADLSRPESVFNAVVKDHQQGFEVDWTAVPPNFRKAGIEGLPYHAAALTVASLLEVECNHSTILRFLAFISRVQPEYRNLLEQKDSRALLILAYWYAKVCTYNQWWVRKRANLECRSICMYLDHYHSGDDEVMKLATYPKIMCGLLPRDTELADEWGRTGDLILPPPGPDDQTMVDLGNLCGMQSLPPDTEI